MKSTLTCLLIFLNVLLIAQSPTFSIYGGPAFSSSSAETSTGYLFETIDIDDSTALRTINQQDVHHHFNDKAGFDIGFKIDIPIHKKWRLSTGLGASNTRFSKSSTFGNTYPSNLFNDSIFLRRNPMPMNFFDPAPNQDTTCGILNRLDFFYDSDPTVHYSIVHLSVPLHLQYAFNEKLSIEAGLEANALIYSSIPFRSLSTYRTISTDENGVSRFICTNNPEQQHDRSGNGFSTLVFKINVGLNYWFNSRFGAGLNLSRTINSVFPSARVDAITIPYGVGPQNTVIYRAGLSLRYKLWTVPQPPKPKVEKTKKTKRKKKKRKRKKRKR